MTLPSAAEVEHADWPALKGYASGLGLNPKGRSGIVRMRVLDHLRAQASGVEWRAGKAEQAALLTRLGSADVAARLWESTISLDAPAPWVGLGNAYLRAGRIEEAVKCFDRAIGMGDPGARLHKAHAMMKAGASDAALAEVEEALAARSEDPRGWAQRAALAEASGRADEALASYAKLAELGRGRLGLARALMKAGRFEEAERALIVHLSHRPDDPVAWNNRGVCLAKRGLWKDALWAFRKAAALDPRGPGILNNLACTLAATGKVDEALRRLHAARRLAEDPRILLNEAFIQERRRAPARAREAYARALEIAPERPEASTGKRRAKRVAKRPAPRPTRPRKLARRRTARRSKSKSGRRR